MWSYLAVAAMIRPVTCSSWEENDEIPPLQQGHIKGSTVVTHQDFISYDNDDNDDDNNNDKYI